MSDGVSTPEIDQQIPNTGSPENTTASQKRIRMEIGPVGGPGKVDFIEGARVVVPAETVPQKPKKERGQRKHIEHPGNPANLQGYRLGRKELDPQLSKGAVVIEKDETHGAKTPIVVHYGGEKSDGQRIYVGTRRLMDFEADVLPSDVGRNDCLIISIGGFHGPVTDAQGQTTERDYRLKYRVEMTSTGDFKIEEIKSKEKKAERWKDKARQILPNAILTALALGGGLGDIAIINAVNHARVGQALGAAIGEVPVNPLDNGNGSIDFGQNKPDIDYIKHMRQQQIEQQKIQRERQQNEQHMFADHPAQAGETLTADAQKYIDYIDPDHTMFPDNIRESAINGLTNYLVTRQEQIYDNTNLDQTQRYKLNEGQTVHMIPVVQARAYLELLKNPDNTMVSRAAQHFANPPDGTNFSPENQSDLTKLLLHRLNRYLPTKPGI